MLGFSHCPCCEGHSRGGLVSSLLCIIVFHNEGIFSVRFFQVRNEWVNFYAYLSAVRFRVIEVRFLYTPPIFYSIYFLILNSKIMSEEAIKAANMTAFKMALAPMQVIVDGKRIIVADDCTADGFIGKSTVDKVAGACCLFGFSGYYITDSAEYGLCFRIY